MSSVSDPLLFENVENVVAENMSAIGVKRGRDIVLLAEGEHGAIVADNREEGDDASSKRVSFFEKKSTCRSPAPS